MTPSADPDEVLRLLRTVAAAVGAELLDPTMDTVPGDVPLVWQGEVRAILRPPVSSAELHGALERLIAQVEAELGVSMGDMDRAQKQRAVRRLDEQGAFLLRGAVENIARTMGTSRVTLYNYLNMINRADPS